MLDSLSLNPFKFSDAGKKKSSPFGFYMLKKDNNLFDGVTGTPASCTISGARWGIVNGVVAQFAANVPPVEDEGLRGCPAFTQLAKYTEDLTNAAWTKNNILPPVLAGTFQGQNVWNCAESTTANAYHNLIQSVGLSALPDNSVVGMGLLAKYSGRKVSISLQTKSNTYVGARFNLQAGVAETNTGLAASIMPLGSGYYYIFFAASLLTGATSPLLYMQTTLENTTPQYTGDGVSGIYLGQPTLINFGVNGIPFIPPYVPNNTGSSVAVVSEVGGASNGVSFDLDDVRLSRLKNILRGPNAQGHIELTFKSNVDSGWLANNTNLNIFSVSNSNLPLYYRKNTDGTVTNWNLYDGTNAANIVQSLSGGQTYRISIDYGTYTDGTQKMRITVNGVKSNVVAFSGSFGTQDLRFFFGSTVHAGWIKDLKIYSRPIW